jgi:hypothetical protein
MCYCGLCEKYYFLYSFLVCLLVNVGVAEEIRRNIISFCAHLMLTFPFFCSSYFLDIYNGH